MGKDKRAWRKLVKKLRRQKKRRERVSCLEDCRDPGVEEDDVNSEQLDDENQGSNGETTSDKELDATFFLSPLEWEAREEQAQLASVMQRAQEECLRQIEEDNQRKIREEWETKQEQERKIKEEKERLEKMLKEKQVQLRGLYCFQGMDNMAESDHFFTMNISLGSRIQRVSRLSLWGTDIETPPTRYLMPDETTDETDICYYFSKTATCRLYERCNKAHPRPTLSTAILIPNFFSHFKLEQSVRDEFDSDLGLEYDDEELYQEFLDFYNDVVPELRKSGTLMQFKVCCNLEPHLRGNLYVQYRTIKEAVEAYRKFNGRFYNGKQLSLQFIKMDSWRSAICGSFLRKACIKGRSCNYLHVFRNPTKEFVKADHDWKDNFRPSLPTTLPSAVNLIPPKVRNRNSSHNSEDRRVITSHINVIPSSDRDERPALETDRTSPITVSETDKANRLSPAQKKQDSTSSSNNRHYKPVKSRHTRRTHRTDSTKKRKKHKKEKKAKKKKKKKEKRNKSREADT